MRRLDCLVFLGVSETSVYEVMLVDPLFPRDSGEMGRYNAEVLQKSLQFFLLNPGTLAAFDEFSGAHSAVSELLLNAIAE